MGNGEAMTDDLERIRNFVVANQAEAVRFITERDEEIERLRQENDKLRHLVLSRGFEISARNAAAFELHQELREAKDQIRELMRESAKGAGTVPAFVRVTHTEQTHPPSDPDGKEEPQAASLDGEMTHSKTPVGLRSENEAGGSPLVYDADGMTVDQEAYDALAIEHAGAHNARDAAWKENEALRAENERLSRGWDHGALYEQKCTAIRAENEKLREALTKTRAAIIQAAMDTLWVGEIETAVDCIDYALEPTQERQSSAGYYKP